MLNNFELNYKDGFKEIYFVNSNTMSLKLHEISFQNIDSFSAKKKRHPQNGN